MHKYNWGIIGTGWIAHEMADALNEVNGEIYAVSNPNCLAADKTESTEGETTSKQS